MFKMSRALMIFEFLGIIMISQVAAHGHLSVPTPRDYNLLQSDKNTPNAFPLDTDFVCRHYNPLPESMWTTLVAGRSSNMTWAFEAAHPGDCFAYITYDADLPESQMRWFKIKEWNACNMHNLEPMPFTLPSYLPSCEHCILRWEWLTTHLQSISLIEYYSQCADIKIIGSDNGQLPTPQVTIPGHLPMDAQYYTPGYGYGSDRVRFTGPPVATIGGSPYSCVSTYDNSCNVAAPTNNPCKISTQRCMSSSTYQACGIGLTTTVWGPEQSCQTGLVCANHTDGEHIMCTYPTDATPSAPSSQPVPSTNSGTPSSDQVCTIQHMRCHGDSTYQTCTNGRTSNYWAEPQSCQTGLYCTPNGNYIYCGLTKPEAPIADMSSSSSTSSDMSEPSPMDSTSSEEETPSPPVGTSTSTSVSSCGHDHSAPHVDSSSSSTSSDATVPETNVPETTVPEETPSSTPNSGSPSSDPSSSLCYLGDQKCTSSESYQTCAILRDGSTYWGATQFCQSGLTCHPSTTANSIYCY